MTQINPAAELQQAAFLLRNPFHGLKVVVDTDLVDPLAEWLESVALTVEAVTEKYEDAAPATAHWLAPALVVARQILGTTGAVRDLTASWDAAAGRPTRLCRCGFLPIACDVDRVACTQPDDARDVIQRVQALAAQWLSGGGPALGTSINRWWDTRLAELHTALNGEPADTCRPVTVDGETIRVRGGLEMTEEDRAALADVIRAAKRRYAAEHPEPTVTDRHLDTLEHLRAQVEQVRALHQPTEGLGYNSDEAGSPYGYIAQACTTCGRTEEYAVRWPCPTYAACTEALSVIRVAP